MKCLSTKISMSEGSCDTEDWSNGCWKFSFAITGLNYILKYIKIENSYFKCNKYYCFTCIFDECSFGKQTSFKNNTKSFCSPKLLNNSVYRPFLLLLLLFICWKYICHFWALWFFDHFWHDTYIIREHLHCCVVKPVTICLNIARPK